LLRKKQEPPGAKQWKSSTRIQEERITKKKKESTKINGKHKTRDGFTHNSSFA